MPQASFCQVLSTLPLHAQLMLALMAGSGLACLGVAAVGALGKTLQRRAHAVDGLPEIPRRPRAFPFAGDRLYTAAFVLFLLWSAAIGLLPSDTPPKAQALGWGALLLGIATQLGIYLPMLLRYGCLHPLQRPSRPWWHYIALPVLFWLAICLSITLLEVSGFTPWLIRVTQCPEHQDVVLIFSRGDVLQRLYIIICAVIIAPLAEECCFRGFLYTTLRHWGGRAAAALASALLFGAIHASLAQMVPLTLFGIAQCIAYEKARSLWLPIAIHMLFNTTSLIATALMLP